MRLRHIEVFHAVYTTGSITSAARMLYVSQPSVSKVLAHAESQLGFALFERNRGKLTPTAEADMLFDEVDKIYRQLFTVRRKAENIRQHRAGVVDIAVTPALGFERVPDTIARFRQTHPDVQFKLQTLHNEAALQSLLESRCSLLMLYSSPAMPGVAEIDLGESEMVLLYPRSQYPDMPPRIPLSALASMELIDIWDSGPLGALIWQQLAEAGIEVTSSLQVDTYYIAANLVRKGMGCCTIDKYTASANLSPDLAMVAFDPPLTFTIKGLHLQDTPLPRVCQDFIAFFQRETARIAGDHQP